MAMKKVNRLPTNDKASHHLAALVNRSLTDMLLIVGTFVPDHLYEFGQPIPDIGSNAVP
jgi:hypothetical protein